jgi:DNA/RNA endonuclease YhcR with UshA esterase domain
MSPNYTIFALPILVIVGLGLVYYSVSLTESAETQIVNLENFPKGSLVKISGEISKLSKSKAGNIYWTLDDGTGTITVPLFGSIAVDYSSITKNSLVTVTGLVSEYNGELEITPKEIEVQRCWIFFFTSLQEFLSE